MQANQQRREFFIKKTKLTESQSKQNRRIKTTIDVEHIGEKHILSKLFCVHSSIFNFDKFMAHLDD
jgi:hypothetical protein